MFRPVVAWPGCRCVNVMNFKTQWLISGTLFGLHLVLHPAASVQAQSPYPCLQNPKAFSASAIPGEAAWTPTVTKVEAPLAARTARNSLLQMPTVPARIPLDSDQTERPLRAGEPLDLLQASIARLVPEWRCARPVRAHCGSPCR